MNWIEELDKHGYNFLVDELVWHLKLGRMPIAVIKKSEADFVGYEFSFENEKSHYLHVAPEMLEKHWGEAREITEKFPQLGSMEYVVS